MGRAGVNIQGQVRALRVAVANLGACDACTAVQRAAPARNARTRFCTPIRPPRAQQASARGAGARQRAARPPLPRTRCRHAAQTLKRQSGASMATADAAGRWALARRWPQCLWGRAQATLSMPLSANTEITRSNARYVPSRAPCDTSREHPARACLGFAVHVC